MQKHMKTQNSNKPAAAVECALPSPARNAFAGGFTGTSAALAVSMALALAAGAWGRSGPEHRTLRPLAMGNAFVAVADDKDAMHYNPAGLNLMGRLGNANLRPRMSRYPMDKFDMHM